MLSNNFFVMIFAVFDVCMAVNTMDKLQFSSFIFAVLLSITVMSIQDILKNKW